MAIVQPSTGGKAPTIDDDIYEVVCMAVTERILETPDQFGKTEKLEFKIELVGEKDDDGEPITLEPRCNKAWSERATLFKWAMAFGIDADPIQPINTDDFIGLSARADIRTESEGKWPRVHDFLPMPKQRTARRPAGPALVTPAGDIAWTVFWGEVDKVGATKASVAAMLPGGLVDLEDMKIDRVIDLLESIKDKAHS